MAFPFFQSPGSVSQARGGAREWEGAHCPSPPANQSQSHCEPPEPQQRRGWPGLVGLGVPSAPHPALEPFILSPGWHLPSCPPLQLCRGTLFVRYILRLVEGNQGNAQGLALSWFQDFGRTGSIKCTTSDLRPVVFLGSETPLRLAQYRCAQAVWWLCLGVPVCVHIARNLVCANCLHIPETPEF